MSRHTNPQIAKRYAKALFELISKGELRLVGEEFKQVIRVLKDSEIKQVFIHPRTKISHKQELIRLMGLTKTLETFLLLVVEKAREDWLEHIQREFELLVLDSEQTTIAEVTSAIALSDAVLQELEAKLQSFTGKTILMRTKIDPSIGGGLVIVVDGKVIDGSVKHTLQQLHYSLTTN